MGEKSGISWTDSTWNPVTGCSRVSPGCEHCYAEALSLRYGWSKKPWTAINAAENVALHPDRLDLPLRWKGNRRIFVNSMSDLFHDQVPDEFIEKVFAVMALADRHTFQVLTKRPKRMREWVLTRTHQSVVTALCSEPGFDMLKNERHFDAMFARLGHERPWPLPNVWLGTSVEDQRRADERVPDLLAIDWPVKFLSCEPLLGPVDLRSIPYHGDADYVLDALGGRYSQPGASGEGLLFAFGMSNLSRLSWVIDGGESGPGFRAADPAWFRQLRDQCQAAGVAYLHKQGSAFRSGQDTLLDGREWHEFPAPEAA